MAKRKPSKIKKTVSKKAKPKKAASKKATPKAAAKKRRNLSKKSQKLLATGRQYYLSCYKPREMVVDRGKGARLWDIDGNDYIDFGAGIAVCSLGYAHPEMIKALTTQAKKLWHTSNIFFTEPTIRLAEELVKASKFAKRIFFNNSGCEANEAAIKLARKYASGKGRPPEKRVILTFQGSFHGRTMATMTATAQPKYQQGFEPLPQGFVYCPFNDFDAVERMMNANVCAVMIESVQGEGGVMPAKPGFLTHLRKLCDKYDALLILDQVQDGMGRTGKLFSHWWEPGLVPDIVTMAKALGGGIPISAMLVGEKASEVFQFGNHGSTFGGNPMATSVARVMLKQLQSRQVQQNVEARSKQLMQGLEKIGQEFSLFREVRGRGLMIGAELEGAARGKSGDISEACRKKGLVVLQAGPDVLRFLPPLVITAKEVDEGLARLRQALSEMQL